MGPFLDERHKVVESGNISLNENSFQYDAFFRHLMAAIESRLSMVSTEILIQPSLKDVHHPYPFPQPPFPNKFSRIRYLSNPQKIVLNGIIIQLLNADIFTDMEMAMISRPKGDIQELTIKALLEQKSLYPIFPPISNDFPVEYKHRKVFELNEQPDILLVQSMQPCFIYVV